MKAVVALVALLAIVGVAVASSEGQLIVNKHIQNREIIVGSDILVKYTIYNAGNATAYDIRLKDSEWETSTIFKAEHGLYSATWDKLLPGGNITHNIVVSATDIGIVRGNRAIVQYRPTADAELQTVYSSEGGAYQVARSSDFERLNSPHLFEWGTFLGLSVLPLGVPLFLYFSSIPKEALKAKKGKKNKKNN
eukprot:TRINITY_DN68_c4_g1_i1.p1 TRINITY_DN68_c4_g1~~TRINITY_DN68_c4_g1_i1.p1  ORF type:complete len:203 (+),score=95.23 TRINITY_DN68_c4_g1_i1:32-610(+)